MSWNPFRGRDVHLLIAQSYNCYPSVRGDDFMGFLAAILYNEDIPQRIREDYFAGFHIKAENYYQYCKRIHPIGLPDSNRVYTVDRYSETDREATIAGVLGFSSFVVGSFTETLQTGINNNLAGVWAEFQRDWYYDPRNRQVSINRLKNRAGGFSGINDTTHIMVLDEITNFETIREYDEDAEEWDIRHNVWVDVTYWNKSNPNTKLEGNFRYTWRNRNIMEADIYSFSFIPTDPVYDGMRHYFTYGVEDVRYRKILGEYIEIPNYEEVQYEQVEYRANQHYPVMPIRVNGVDITDPAVIDHLEPASVKYHTEQALWILGHDLPEIINNLRANPNQKDIDNAFIFLGADINSDSPYVLTYVFDQFLEILKTQQDNYYGDGSTFMHYEETGGSAKGGESNFEQYISYETITYTLVAEPLLNKVPAFYKEVTHETEDSETYTLHRYNIANFVPSDGYAKTHRVVIYQKSDYYHKDGDSSVNLGDVRYYQLAREIHPNLYEQIEVREIRQDFKVWRDKQSTMYLNELQRGNKGKTHNIRIPLSRNVVKKYPVQWQHYIIKHSISISVQGHDRVHIDWYEDEDFWELIEIISWIFSIYTVGTSTAITQGAKAIILKEIIKRIVIMLAVRELGKYIARKIGGKLGAILAGLVTAVGSAYAGQGFDFTTVGTALQSMQYVMQGYTFYQEQILEQEQDVLSDIRKSTQEVEARQQELEAYFANDIGGDILRRRIRSVDEIIQETPDEFFTRTTFANPGAAVLDNIGRFVDNELQLPDMAWDEHNYS